MNRALQAAIQYRLADALGSAYGAVRFGPSGTGCINETWAARAPGLEPVFIKLGGADALPMYEQEALGLQALRRCEAIRVPGIHFFDRIENDDDAIAAVLVLEFIALASPRAQDDARIGAALAQVHGIQGSAFGFDSDNFIGRTP